MKIAYPPRRIVVAIPVKNEEDRIGACLRALLCQTAPADHILLLLNNCTDASLSICLALQAQHRQILVEQCYLTGVRASAGEARRLALERAAILAGDGVVLTTDADSITPDDWIETNLLEIAKGADAVCGIARIDPHEASLIPRPLLEDHERESACLDLLDEIDSLVDPDPFDPWPRHHDHSGASIATTAQAFRLAGGAPHVAMGEDRALIANLARGDARIRHAPEIIVTVSGRLEGRAVGGMADTIKRRMIARDEFTDERLEPAIDAYRRSLAKAALRAVWNGETSPDALARDLLVDFHCLLQVLRDPYFGTAWARIQATSPVLRRRRVPVAALPREIMQAASLRDQLREESTTKMPSPSLRAVSGLDLNV